MLNQLRVLFALVVVLIPVRHSQAQANQTGGDSLRIVAGEDIPWRRTQGGFDIAITDGNPATPGSVFTMMLRLPDGVWINPHWHNTAERILVVEGIALIGDGRKVDEAVVRSLGPGSVVVIPAERVHYAGGRGQTILMVYGVGPFRTTFVDQSTP